MLAAGTKLGPYEIVAPLGAGGMGEVYKAADKRLDRIVAVKILPAALAVDPQFRDRFDREARAISQLTHPRICRLYDVGVHDGTSFLVMELLDGETLADRLTKGALPPAQALTVAIAIASALDAAHRAGIVHRDLKPGNVMLTKAGAKLLDFGLAKTNAPVVAVGGTMAPTTPSITAQGAILGTFQYMAPEQIEGVDADARTDIFAFGGVLFEMLTGRTAFEGKTRARLLGAILKDEPPPVSRLQPVAPPALDRLVARCLAKDPDDRWQSARDVMHELQWVADEGASVDRVAPTASLAAPRSAWSRAVPWTLAAMLGVALIAGLLVWAPWRSAPVPTLRRLLASIGADASLVTNSGVSAILSPDGTTLAFVALQADRARLFIRKLDQLQASALAGTEGAGSPFFSPDGQWIAFFAGGQLKKVSVTGGAAVKLCDALGGRGGTWTDDDTIIFMPAGGPNVTLMRVPAAGGTPAVFGTFSEGAVVQRSPQALPGGQGVLYTEHSATSEFDAANLVVAPLSGGPSKVVVRGGYHGRYVSSGPGSTKLAASQRGLARRSLGEGGHLVYVQQGTLFAVPFDLDRLETTGQSAPVLEGLVANPTTGGAQLAFSSEGTLVYVPGTAATAATAIDWMTRDGKTSVLRATKANWSSPRFSPGGEKLAIEISDGKQSDIWVYEWARDTLTQLTFDPGQDQLPVWTPDGRRLAFASDRAKPGVTNLYWMNADGTGEVTRLTESPENESPYSWHPSGKFLAFTAVRPATSTDLMILPMEGDGVRGWTPGKPTVFLGMPAPEAFPMFSPDGRWIAYFLSGSGGDVYVRPFPGPGGTWRVSAEPATYPRWSATAHELLFYNRGQLMFAPYAIVGNSFRADKPRIWSPTIARAVGRGYPYDLHPDGKRLAVAAVDGNVVQDKVVFVLNFFDYLRTIAPGRQ